MDKWILVVGSNSSDPSKEKEFNDWYDNIHLPDVLEIDGFVGATRYENKEPGEGEAKFLAIYEIETDDIDDLMKRHGDNVSKKREQGRFSDLLEVVNRGIYRQTKDLRK
jgi:hypothetical protein